MLRAWVQHGGSAALLEVQDIRSTKTASADAATARSTPDVDSPTVLEDEARRALATARATVDAAKQIIESGWLSPFD